MDRDKRNKLIGGALILALILGPYFYGIKNKDKANLSIEETSFSSSAKALAKPKEVVEKKAYIVGEVKNPGVYTFKDGDRLDDLVKLAGGFTQKADIKKINLAIRLKDEMKILVPSLDSNEKVKEDQADELVESPSNDTQDSKQKVNINTADKASLMTLPNIGEKRADAIINYRKDQKFKKTEDIMNVTGIGKKYYDSLKDYIVVDGD